MESFRHRNVEEIPPQHVEHGQFEYYKKEFVSKHDHQQCVASVYQVPPGKAAYPYHYHTKRQEVFYIISGRGTLRTPEGEREVRAGDLLYFPNRPEGAHKIVNHSEEEPLVYLNVDMRPDLDVAVYPDSGKVGVWGCGINKVFPMERNVDYYEGE